MPALRAMMQWPSRRRSAAALLPASLTAAALVAAPFAGSTTGPLTASVKPASQSAAPARTPTAAMPVLDGAYLGIAATAATASVAAARRHR